MTKYEQLMARINKSTVKPTQDKSLLSRAEDTMKDAYANTARAAGEVYEAVHLNLVTTPALFEKGRESARESVAERLDAILNRK